MTSRARARAMAARQTDLRPGWLALAAAAALTAMAGGAHGQPGPTASDAVPPATSQAAPAEILPGHPPPPTSAQQTVVPSPVPPGTRADTPGGSAKNGVIAPPATAVDPEMNKGAPGAGALATPVIPPPGSPGGNPRVVPK